MREDCGGSGHCIGRFQFCLLIFKPSPSPIDPHPNRTRLREAKCPSKTKEQCRQKVGRGRLPGQTSEVVSKAQRGDQEERTTDEAEKKSKVKRDRSDSLHDDQGKNREVQQQILEDETKEKGGRRGRSRCNVHSVVATLGELRQKITIIYIRTRKKQNGEAEGAVSESHLIFSSRRRSVSSKVQRAAASPRCH